MKRMHVHVGVEDLPKAIGFYSALFATQPTVVKADYAKWMLDDPRVNFAISTRGKRPGLDHLGIQVESEDRAGRCLCASAPSRRHDHRAGADDLLLRRVRKIVDRRSRGNFLGDVLHHRREHRLWRERRKRPARGPRRACPRIRRCHVCLLQHLAQRTQRYVS